MPSLIIRFGKFLVAALGLYLLAMLVMARVPINGLPLVFRTADYYTWPGGDSWACFREFMPDTTYDAVVLGSSHAYRGYDPYVFAEEGYRVFNLGTSAQTPLNSYFILKRYLDSTNAPLIIFDIHEGVLINDGFESTSDLTINLPDAGPALGMAVAQRDLRTVNLVALRMGLDRRAPYYTEPGYLGLGYSPKPDSLKAAIPGEPRPVVLNERQGEFLERCIRLCNERGMRMVIVSHYARANMRGDYHRPLTNYLDSLLGDTEVPYLDFSSVPGIEDMDWFYDYNHLNRAGARHFTRQLVDSLEALGYLQPR